MSVKLAPIVLFVYNRPWHTQQTIEALQINELAKESELFIYSDAEKSNIAGQEVDKVRSYVKSIDGFKKITIIEREENWGLAKSIIQGVTEIVNQYGKVIVMEDDIVTSPLFLQFMNNGLDFYEQNKKVWHLSGWSYPISTKGLHDMFLWRVMNCWGWGTWIDRWQYFEKDPAALIENWSAEEKYRFDLDGSGVFWSQVEANASKKINTWAIFWYATIFKNYGLCLNPTVSYVENIGHDGSGVNCGRQSLRKNKLSKRNDLSFPNVDNEHAVAVARIKTYLKSSFLLRIKRKVIYYVLG
jgi:hypothetical protein